MVNFLRMSLHALWVPSIFILSLAAIIMAQRPAIRTPPPPPPTRAPPPPPTRAPPPPRRRTVRCRSLLFPLCFNVPLPCPPGCPRTCLADCRTCSPVCSCNFPGAVCQDPRFVGGDGMTFYFHGRKDKDFCLVSDENLHVNGHFIGKRNPKLNRDFTWVQSIGIMFNNHRISIAAKRTSTWEDNVDRLSISFDETQIPIPTKEGSKWDFPNASDNITIMRTSNTNGVMLEVSNSFRINAIVVPITAEESKVHSYGITDEDCFAHLELKFKFFNLSDEVDGVLGQTYRNNYVSKAKVNAPMPVMGGAHRYLSSGLFTTDCAVSRFGQNGVANIRKESFPQHSMVKRKNGMTENGVVFK